MFGDPEHGWIGAEVCLYLGDPELGWVGADGAGDNWLQDEAERAGAGGLAQHTQLLLQRLVERPRLQAHEGLPQV